MRTPYRIDDFQQAYFVIDSIQTLQAVTLRDFSGLYERLAGASEIGVAEILPSDTVITRGAQTYAKAGGRLASVRG